MILPARADWPPNSFTPRRLLSLSRPLRDEPPAFLCAMRNCYLIDSKGLIYLAFGAFLVLPLAGAAFFVDADSALGAADFALALVPFAASSFSGAGFSVG